MITIDCKLTHEWSTVYDTDFEMYIITLRVLLEYLKIILEINVDSFTSVSYNFIEQITVYRLFKTPRS